MVTHDLTLAARARRLVRMEDGEVVADAPTADRGVSRAEGSR